MHRRRARKSLVPSLGTFNPPYTYAYMHTYTQNSVAYIRDKTHELISPLGSALIYAALSCLSLKDPRSGQCSERAALELARETRRGGPGGTGGVLGLISTTPAGAAAEAGVASAIHGSGGDDLDSTVIVLTQKMLLAINLKV